MAILAKQLTRSIGTEKSQADAFAMVNRRLSPILRNSTTVRERDLLTRNPAHQLCSASAMNAEPHPANVSVHRP